MSVHVMLSCICDHGVAVESNRTDLTFFDVNGYFQHLQMSVCKQPDHPLWSRVVPEPEVYVTGLYGLLCNSAHFLAD